MGVSQINTSQNFRWICPLRNKLEEQMPMLLIAYDRHTARSGVHQVDIFPER